MSTGEGSGELQTKFAPDAVYEGRFIEVISTESESDGDVQEMAALRQAKANAEVAMGLVARSLGENATQGELVLAQSIVALHGQPVETHADIWISVPSQVSQDALMKLDSQLGELITKPNARQARETALRWYLRGLEARDPQDRLTSHYIGTEAILRSHAKRKGLVALASKPANDDKFATYVAPLSEEYGQEAVDALINRARYRNPSDQECMAQYCKDYGLEDHLRKLRTKSLRQ